MFNIALSRLLNAAYGPTRCLASVGAWVFGFYGCLILAMAMAAGQVAELPGLRQTAGARHWPSYPAPPRAATLSARKGPGKPALCFILAFWCQR